jgi:acetyl-CoA acetyltransferase family protein
MNIPMLLGGLRTPIAKRNGGLAGHHAADLLGTLMHATLESLGVDAFDVNEVIVGCVTATGDQGNNIGRTAWLTAGLPLSIPATTVNAKCGSSQQAAHFGSALVASGAADVIVCAGIEHMTRHPLGQDVGAGLGDPYSRSYLERYEATTQGEAAERIARRWHLDRQRCDAIAVASQERAAAAVARGRFKREILEVDYYDTDEGPRPSTLESLGQLKPVFAADGVLTAGNSSQISDGASCIVIVSEEFAAHRGLSPLAVVEHQCAVGVDPVLKLTGPIPATRRILGCADLGVDDIDVIEVNEAFASVLGAWISELGIPLEKINVNGGAIALGHPVGATGTRLLLTAAHELRDSGAHRALVTMCCGGGLGTATILRAPD